MKHYSKTRIFGLQSRIPCFRSISSLGIERGNNQRPISSYTVKERLLFCKHWLSLNYHHFDILTPAMQLYIKAVFYPRSFTFRCYDSNRWCVEIQITNKVSHAWRVCYQVITSTLNSDMSSMRPGYKAWLKQSTLHYLPCDTPI